MKRFLSALLIFCLLAALGVSAHAESTDMEAALQEITLHVKDILEIDDEYAEFSGSYNDGLRPGWNLVWSDVGRDLSVTCDREGVITEVYRWDDSGRRSPFYGFDAAFPVLPADEARSRAEYWLDRLAGPGETARIDRTDVSLQKDGDYRFAGVILINGLDSPVTFHITIGGAGLTGYSRSDGYSGYVGDIPSPRPAVKQGDAAKALKDAVVLDLYYVTDGGGQARLRYVPAGPHTVVEAQTGEAVDMDELYASLGSAYNGKDVPMETEAAMAMDNGTGRGLTEVELSSIANYADALPQESIDVSLRSIPNIGLEDFELVRCSYAMGADGDITASLRYTGEMTEKNLYGFSLENYREVESWGDPMIVTKYVTADAKTGELITLSTSYPLWERAAGESGDIGEETAQDFLRACAPERFEQTAVREDSDADGQSEKTYARMHDGWFFPENYLYVRINDATETVDEFRFAWDDKVGFAPSEGIVTADEALASYVGALDLTLGYTAWPEGIDYDDPVLYRYAEWGYTYVESLRLAYWYDGTEDVAGVDALTGEAIVEPRDGSYAYDDLAGVQEAEAIEALGAAGIGFAGGSFRPASELTMGEAACILLQAAGYRTEDWNDETLRGEAAGLGFITADAWEPDRVVTETEFLRMILGASRYGDAAELKGIWGEYGGDGYAAIAHALDMPPARPAACTRAAAAELLWRFMMRT